MIPSVTARREPHDPAKVQSCAVNLKSKDTLCRVVTGWLVNNYAQVCCFINLSERSRFGKYLLQPHSSAPWLAKLV